MYAGERKLHHYIIYRNVKAIDSHEIDRKQMRKPGKGGVALENGAFSIVTRRASGMLEHGRPQYNARRARLKSSAKRKASCCARHVMSTITHHNGKKCSHRRYKYCNVMNLKISRDRKETALSIASSTDESSSKKESDWGSGEEPIFLRNRRRARR